jgi:excisionase family DNA binding protein
MNIQEKRKAFEKLLAGAPEVMPPLQVPKWTPYGRNTVYAMLRSGKLPSIQYRGTHLISKAELVEYMTAHADIRCIDGLNGNEKGLPDSSPWGVFNYSFYLYSVSTSDKVSQ